MPSAFFSASRFFLRPLFPPQFESHPAVSVPARSCIKPSLVLKGWAKSKFIYEIPSSQPVNPEPVVCVSS
jgi:hypothetical protein